MTADDGRFAPPVDRRPAPYIRCGRCQVAQPLQSTARQRCVSCGAPLRRWVAHPPAVGGPGGSPGNGGAGNGTPGTGAGIVASTAARLGKTRGLRRARPYAGPPSYRGGHPQWAFPPVIWRDLPDETPIVPVDEPAGALRWSAGLALATAVAALVASGAEIWRFVLLLEGRTLVLSGPVVRSSDVLVAASGLAVLTFALLLAAFAVPALVRTHFAAARRLGSAPSRSRSDIVARLLVPIWNVYGAGQIVTEIDRMMARRPDAGSNSASGAYPSARRRATATESDGPALRTRGSRLVKAWWLSWVLSAVLITVTLARGFGGSLQAIADTVELHIAVDVMAALVAGLAVAILLRFSRGFTDRAAEFEDWVVQPPAPTRRML